MTAGDAPAPDSRERILAVSDGLSAFLAGSEDVFLEVGRRLAALEQRARSLVESARAAAALRAEDAADPARDMRRELARMDAHFLASRRGVEDATRRLESLAARLEQLARLESRLDGIPPTLRMLALNTRIENARASARYVEMESVALEVRRLGDVIEPKLRTIFQQGAHLLRTVHVAVEAAGSLQREQDGSSADTLENAREAASTLEALLEAGGKIAARAVVSWDHLTRDVGNLLVALQGHDATRQAIEHVLAELRDLAAEAVPAAARPEHVAEAARLMSAQVSGARVRLVQSLEGIAASLRALAATCAGLSEEMARFVSSGSGTAAVEVVRRAVEQATRRLVLYVAHEEATGQAMERVTATVQEMGGSVKDILGIGAEVKLIALNALVQTEHAGQEGRVLGVLAQGIGTLAGEVVQGTAEVSRSLEEISSLGSQLRSDPADRRAEGDSIAGALEQLGARLAGIQRGLTAAVARLQDESRRLTAEAEALAAHVTAVSGSTIRLAELEVELLELSELGAPGAAGVGQHRPGRQERAYARYTMENERAIHEAVVNGVERTRATPAADGGGASGLGANVEFF